MRRAAPVAVSAHCEKTQHAAFLPAEVKCKMQPRRLKTHSLIITVWFQQSRTCELLRFRGK